MYIKQINCGGVHNGGNIVDTTILNTMLQDDLDEGKDSVYLIQEPWYEKKSKRRRTRISPLYALTRHTRHTPSSSPLF